jgi:hypothetical protein|tara:strand:- start:519 stop:974 length:456 start_codon:yes stop_codon:yes gene_type:complete
MTSPREFTSRRIAIIDALVEKLEEIDGSGNYRTDLNGNVSRRLKFWDEVDEFPALHISAGAETREYLGAQNKTRFMTVTIRCYVNDENSVEALEGLMEDVETVLDTHSRLRYVDRKYDFQYTQLITVLSLDTDEGVLEPLGVGEIVCEVRY